MASEWANRHAAEFCELGYANQKHLLAVASMLDRVRADGRREGLEEAAMMAEAPETRALCLRIRARITQEPTA